MLAEPFAHSRRTFPRFSVRVLTHLKRMTNRSRLLLFDTRISDAGLADLTGLRKLTVLELGLDDVSDVGLAHLRGLINLSTLRLAATRVSDSGLAHLSGLTKLSLLRLHRTSVSDAGLATLRALSKLVDMISVKLESPTLERKN